MTEPTEPLKNCPFCGAGESQIHVNKGAWNGRGYGEPVSVEVRHWCADVPGQPSRMISRAGRDEASAIAAWNTRTTPQPTQSELRRLHTENALLQAGYDAARLEIDHLRGATKTVEPAHPVAWLVYLPSIDTQHLYYSQEDMGYVDDVTNHADAEVTPLYEMAAPKAEVEPAGEYPPLPAKQALYVFKGKDGEREEVHGYDELQMWGFVDADRAMRAQAAHAAVAGQCEDAIELLGKYNELCEEIKRGDSYHIGRIDAAISVLAQAAPQPAVQQGAGTRQEPVAWQSRTRPTWGSNTTPWYPWEICTKEQAEDYWKTPLLHGWAYEARALCIAPQAAPVAQGDALAYEQQVAIRQGHEIAASDSYFDARPQIDNNDRLKVFEAGFERGWDAARAQAKEGDQHG